VDLGDLPRERSDSIDTGIPRSLDHFPRFFRVLSRHIRARHTTSLVDGHTDPGVRRPAGAHHCRLEFARNPVMTLQRSAGRFILLVAIVLGGLSATKASAVSVFYLDAPDDLKVGFDPTTPDFPTDVDGILPLGGPYVPADNQGIAPVQYSLEHCFLVVGGTGCQGTIFEGDAYSDVVTLTLESVEGGMPSDGIVLFLSGMASFPAYEVDDVAVELDPTNPDFTFDDFLHLTLTVSESTFHYFGFELDTIGESVTFQYDVAEQLLAGTPVFTTNALVPEPSTALLVGIGLLGLAFRQRR
jgi:hypothetical protein